MGVCPGLERGWSTQQNLFLTFLICEGKTPCRFKIILVFFSLLLKLHFSPSVIGVPLKQWDFFLRSKTVFTRRRDLDTCTGDGWKYWPRRGWATQQHLFLSFLICEVETGPTCKLFLFFMQFSLVNHGAWKCVWKPGLSACAEWILSFVQEMGVSTDPGRGCSTQQNLFRSFLICEAETGPTFKSCPFLCNFYPSKSQYIKMHALNGSWALYRRWV